MNSKLTIAIPTYNRGANLDTQLSWAVADIGDRWDLCNLVVSDNASPDTTPAVCEKWHAVLGEHLTVYRQRRNIGSGNNFHFVIDQATSEYVWVVSDDDAIAAGTVRAILELLTQNESLGLLHLNFRTTDNYDGPTVQDHVYPWTDDQYAAPGAELYQQCLLNYETALLLITASILKKQSALAAIADWPGCFQNSACFTYLSGYAALTGPMCLRGKPSLTYPLHSGNLQRWLVTEFYHMPEVYLRFAKLGYDRALMRALILRRATILNFMRKFPLEFAKSLRVYSEAMRLRTPPL